jgi:hypothetical protein
LTLLSLPPGGLGGESVDGLNGEGRSFINTLVKITENRLDATEMSLLKAIALFRPGTQYPPQEGSTLLNFPIFQIFFFRIFQICGE